MVPSLLQYTHNENACSSLPKIDACELVSTNGVMFLML